MAKENKVNMDVLKTEIEKDIADLKADENLKIKVIFDPNGNYKGKKSVTILDCVSPTYGVKYKASVRIYTKSSTSSITCGPISINGIEKSRENVDNFLNSDTSKKCWKFVEEDVVTWMSFKDVLVKLGLKTEDGKS